MKFTVLALLGLVGVCAFAAQKNAKGAHLLYEKDKIVQGYASEKTKIAIENAAEINAAANELLAFAEGFRDDWDYGNAIHHAHLAIGRVALARGLIPQAVDQMLLAGQTTGSPQLDSFGPNMTLAKELLARGEKRSVLTYFDSCRKFWNDDIAKGKLTEWEAAIAAGKTPNFGGNLFY